MKLGIPSRARGDHDHLDEANLVAFHPPPSLSLSFSFSLSRRGDFGSPRAEYSLLHRTAIDTSVREDVRHTLNVPLLESRAATMHAGVSDEHT
jgi:hypothetical protein